MADILIVEPDADRRERLCAVLPADRHLVFTDDGPAALKHLETAERLPALLLSGIGMAPMDGFQLAERLHRDERWSRIPVLLFHLAVESDSDASIYLLDVSRSVAQPSDAAQYIRQVLEKGAIRRSKPKRSTPPREPGHDWLRQLTETVQECLVGSQFSVDELAEKMNIGRKTLYRIVREHTGLSVNEYIQSVRLQRGRALLESRQVANLRQVAHAVGLGSADHFSRLYRKHYGHSPAVFLTKQKASDK